MVVAVVPAVAVVADGDGVGAVGTYAVSAGGEAGTGTARAAAERRSCQTVHAQTATGAREIASPSTAQVRIATWVWSRTTEATSEESRTAAQKRWIRKVSSRSGDAWPPLGVTMNRPSVRRTAEPSDFR